MGRVGLRFPLLGALALALILSGCGGGSKSNSGGSGVAAGSSGKSGNKPKGSKKNKALTALRAPKVEVGGQGGGRISSAEGDIGFVAPGTQVGGAYVPEHGVSSPSYRFIGA